MIRRQLRVVKSRAHSRIWRNAEIELKKSREMSHIPSLRFSSEVMSFLSRVSMVHGPPGNSTDCSHLICRFITNNWCYNGMLRYELTPIEWKRDFSNFVRRRYFINGQRWYESFQQRSRDLGALMKAIVSPVSTSSSKILRADSQLLEFKATRNYPETNSLLLVTCSFAN